MQLQAKLNFSEILLVAWLAEFIGKFLQFQPEVRQKFFQLLTIRLVLYVVFYHHAKRTTAL